MKIVTMRNARDKHRVTNISFQRLQSPMHIAAEQGYTEICKLLLAAGANIQQREQVRFTKIMFHYKHSLAQSVENFSSE